MARSCAPGDNLLLPHSGWVPISTPYTNGLMAILHTGDVAVHFGLRNYGFDTGFETL